MKRLIALLTLCAVAAAQDVLVITPDDFRPALKEWREHREAQGCTITVKAPAGDLRGLVKGGKFTHVLLLGDVKQVPCNYVPANIIRRWERDVRIASDNQVADLDGDGLPDLAIGRLPADDAEEAAALLAKVIAYEKNADFGSWRRRVNVIAGVGGFGKLQDRAIEIAATHFLSTNIPYAYDLHVTYANASSAFCPPPTEVGAISVERFNEGALLVTYLGHGSRLNLDSMRFGDRFFRIFGEDHAYELKARHGAPIAVLVCCSAGHVDGAPDCLAEVMLKQPKGPVAILASSRVSMPYANGVLAKELLEAIFEQRLPTLGEVLAQAKRRLMKPKENDAGRTFIEGLARFYEPDEAKRAEERAEHLYLYNLLGDPALRIPLPQDATVEGAQDGRKLAVKGSSPVDGQALVELVEQRSPNRPKRTGDSAAEFRKAYQGANARTKLQAKLTVAGGRFGASLDLPEGIGPGTYYLRVFVSGTEGAALGSVKLELK